MTEATLQRYIRGALRALGAVVYKTHGSMFTQAGVLDLIIGYQGRYFELEVKLPGRRLTPLQQQRLLAVAAAGCIAKVVHSVEEALMVIENAKVPDR